MTSTSARRRVLGFTMVELMITITVLLVIAVIAVPSFISFRQRSALRGGADQALAFWNQVRLESAKRNTLIKVGVFVDGDDFCLGAATTTTLPADVANHDVPCDCMVADADECNVAQFPALIDDGAGNLVSDQASWRGVTLNGTPTLGEDSGAAVIESRRTSLINPDMEGSITFSAPPGPNDYRLNLFVDRQGRATLCQSNSAGDLLSDYLNRTCDP
jgi:prepilin-type N-terminal cleavage/methylation domain-containing protein